MACKKLIITKNTDEKKEKKKVRTELVACTKRLSTINEMSSKSIYSVFNGQSHTMTT